MALLPVADASTAGRVDATVLVTNCLQSQRPAALCRHMCRAYHNARHEGCNACIRHSDGAAPHAMTFSDSDWTREPPHARRAQARRRSAMLTALISLACVALAIGWYGIEQILDARTRSQAVREIGAIPAPPAAGPAAAAPPLPLPASAATAPAPPATASAAADAQAMAALEAEMRQRAREAAQQAAIDAVRRKERAWERWYQRPTFCNENPTSAQMVECANHHIRARKEFEERYAAGRL
jgi:hypothetical protein